jgi:hypothetical protein
VPPTSSASRDALQNRAAKLTITGVFLTLMALFSARLQRRGEDLEIRPFDLLMLGLSAYRAGHMLAYERVAEPLREPFTETKPDESGAGKTVVAAGSGFRRSFGELLSCPICVGTWVSAGLVYGLHLAPRWTRVFLAVMSSTGVAEIVYSSTEALTWIGRDARKRVGSPTAHAEHTESD